MFERLGHRALSVCLSVILIFLCAPLSAFADESGSTGTDDSFAASTDVASQNEVVALGEFVALDETVSLCDTVASLSIAEAFTPPSGLVYLGSTRFSYGGLKYLITSGTDVQVCGYTADMPAELEIPSQIIDGATTYSVTSIGNSVFTNNQALVSIRIPASVTGIGYDAFMDCRSLTKVELPDSAITQIRQFTFSGCTSLSYFDFPTQLESIGANAFRSTAFETLVLPDSLTMLGSSAFAQNPKLSSVMFGTTLTGIGQSAFDQCPSLASIVFSGPRIAYDFGSASVECTVRFYDANGDLFRTLSVPTGSVPAGQADFPDVPSVAGMWGQWVPDPGFSLDEAMSDSFSVHASYSDTPVVSIADCTFAAIPTQTYTGVAIRPSLVIEDGDTVLIDGEDYFVFYKNNTMTGTATAIVTGLGNYTGLETLTYTIAVAPGQEFDIAQAQIATIENRAYSGELQEPPSEITYQGYALVAGVDYDVAYSDAVEIGTATAVITGKGNFTGTAIATFTIDLFGNPTETGYDPTALLAVMRKADAIDRTLYAPSSLVQMDDAYSAAQELLTKAETDLAAGLAKRELSVFIQRTQLSIDSKANTLYLLIVALENRMGDPTVVVVKNADTLFYSEPSEESVTAEPATRGSRYNALSVDPTAGSPWYYVDGKGYLKATDIFEYPPAGQGITYNVTVMQPDTQAREYPFEWATPMGKVYMWGDTVDVETVDDKWLLVKWTDEIGVTRYAYLPAEACDPTEDSDAVLAGQITDPTTTSDPNAGDPDDLNTETRSSDPTSHLDGWGDDEGEQGLYPEGVVLIDSWPKNNATAVSRTARFWVKFPHNVADSASFDLNTSKVSLIKADGTPVPCTVYTLDRQLYPETRRFIFIQPTSALDWGTKYKIVVLPGVMAHNMNSSYETYVITFSTEVNPFASGGGSASVPAPTGSGIGFYSKVQAAKAGSGGSSTDSGVAGGLVSVGLSEGSSGSSDQSLGAVSETTGAEEGGIVGSIMLLAEVGTPQSANADEEVGGRAPVLPGIIFGAAAAFLLASIFELMRRLDYNKSLRQGE